jgi:hypothetical protein
VGVSFRWVVSSGLAFRMLGLSSSLVDFDERVVDMTTTGESRSHVLPVLVTRLLTRRRVIDQMRTASATCR